MSRDSKTAAHAAVVLATCLAGCFSNEGGSGPSASRNEPLDIWFPTVYSAYLPDGSQNFRVPAVVDGAQPEIWQIEPADAAFLQANRAAHSVVVTPRRAGTFKLTARSGRRSGSVDLVVSEASKELLALGAARFNNGVELELDVVALLAGRQTQSNAACANCHGPTARFDRVDVTPKQLGGYSDSELRELIANGVKPSSAPLSTLSATEFSFSMFHRWAAASEDEYRGLVLYLRSLEPVSSEPPTSPPRDMGATGERDEDIESIGCGPAICEPPPDFKGALCCLSHFDGICGQMVAGSCVDLPAELDPDCEGATGETDSTSIELRGCCAANNQCGVIIDPAPGCTSLTEARTIGRLLRGPDFVRTLPEPRTCDGVPITTNEAGSGG